MYKTNDCYKCLTQFDDAYFCSSADQTSGASIDDLERDGGFCCGGGPVESSLPAAHWKNYTDFMADRGVMPKSDGGVPTSTEGLIPVKPKISWLPRPPQCTTSPTRRWKCSNVPIVKNSWRFAANEGDMSRLDAGLTSEPLKMLKATDDVYKNYLRYLTCLDIGTKKVPEDQKMKYANATGPQSGYFNFKRRRILQTEPVANTTGPDASNATTNSTEQKPEPPAEESSNMVKVRALSACGQRELFKVAQEDPWDGEPKWSNVKVQGVNVCVYRLFSEQETAEQTQLAWEEEHNTQKMLDYEIQVEQSETAELYLVDYNVKTGKSVKAPTSLLEMQQENSGEPVRISYLDYGHSGVYLLAKKKG